MAREARVERYIGYGRTARVARKPPFSLCPMGGEVSRAFIATPRHAPLRSFDTPPPPTACYISGASRRPSASYLRRSVGSRVRARSDVGLERDATSPRLAYTLLTVVVTALHVNYVTYDPKFNDTNVKRLLAAMQDDEHVDKRSPKFKVGDTAVLVATVRPRAVNCSYISWIKQHAHRSIPTLL